MTFVTRLRRLLLRFENERTDDRSSFKLEIELDPDPLDGGWVAQVVDLPGCMSQGETPEEALANVMDALEDVIFAHMNEQLHHSADTGAPVKLAFAH